jgi:hypothetical protein
MKLLAACLALLGVVGCSTSAPYRTNYSTACVYTKQGDCHDNAITRGAVPGEELNHEQNYLLSFIEFDEQGVVQVPESRDKIINHYRAIAKQNDVLLITFIHGWNHNAQGGGSEDSDEDTNIVEFRQVLARAVKQHAAKNIKVLGLYIGWRGRALPGFLNLATYWGRKFTAHEIGNNGDITRTLLDLESVVKDSGRLRSKMVTIGHSFGGAALYSTINLVLMERFIASRRDNPSSNISPEINGFGDLVVLLNPAFEATRFSSLFELSQAGCMPYQYYQKPRLIVLSSTNDLAVAGAFQVGQFFSAMFEEHRDTKATHCQRDGSKITYDVDQFRADTLGIGHFRPYINFDLCAKKAEDRITWEDGKLNISDIWSNSLEDGKLAFNFSELTARANVSMPYTPFMNIYTDGTNCADDTVVMNGHNDIWTEPVLEFLNTTIDLSMN